MNEKLNKLNIEYRKKWGIASHIDNTWWETYGDKVFKIGLEEGKKELASLQEKIEEADFHKIAINSRERQIIAVVDEEISKIFQEMQE